MTLKHRWTSWSDRAMRTAFSEWCPGGFSTWTS
jgi:hypothetical protein